MKMTSNLKPDEMSARIFRFEQRRVHMNHAEAPSIPEEVFAMLNPPIYFLLGHAAAGLDQRSRPAIADAKGLAVVMLDIPPGQGIGLHVHFRSREAFLCLRGRVKFRFNDHGAEHAVLGPWDMISVPLGVYRSFECEGDEPALLLAIVTDEKEGEPEDVFAAPEERERFAARFGGDILEKLTAATGVHYTEPREGESLQPSPDSSRPPD